MIGSGDTEHLVWLHSRFSLKKNAFDKNIGEKIVVELKNKILAEHSDCLGDNFCQGYPCHEGISMLRGRLAI